jgi:alkaline phosphatase D
MTYSDSRYRGYARFDLLRERLGADLRAMESVQKREAACNTLASFAVEDGRPGAVKVSPV